MQYDHRAIFYEVWEKHSRQQPLTDFETDVLRVLLKYPQYTNNMSQQMIHAPKGENPYFILGSHIALYDQVKNNSPKGIQSLYYHACKQHGADKADAMMLTVMRELLTEAYSKGDAPSDDVYLKLLKNICQ